MNTNEKLKERRKEKTTKKKGQHTLQLNRGLFLEEILRHLRFGIEFIACNFLKFTKKKIYV